MNPIRFEFDEQKFQELMLWLAGKVPRLDRLKATKLLYLIDRHCLLETGKPVLGDIYYRMNLGPVPSAAYDRLKKIRASNASYFLREVAEGANPYPIFAPIKPHDESVFSLAEIEAINSIINRFGTTSPTVLSEITHQHRAWTESDDGSPIDYRLFFDDPDGKEKFAYQAMLTDQDDRDFSASL